MQDVGDFCRGWSEAERSGDVAALEGLIAADFIGVGPLGFALSRGDWLERHRSGVLRYRRFELDEGEVRLRGGAAVVTARLNETGTYADQPTPEALRATLALVVSGEAWQLLGLHLSFIAGTPGAPGLPVGAGPEPGR